MEAQLEVRSLCCEGAVLPSAEIERMAQGHLDLRGGGSGGCGPIVTLLRSLKVQRQLATLSRSREEEKWLCWGWLGCLLAKSKNVRFPWPRGVKRATSRGKQVSAERSWRDYRTPRVEQGVWVQPEEFTFSKIPPGEVAVMSGVSREPSKAPTRQSPP